MGHWIKRDVLAAIIAVTLASAACSGGGGLAGGTSVQDRKTESGNGKESGLPEGGGTEGQISQSGSGSTLPEQDGHAGTWKAQGEDGSTWKAQDEDASISKAKNDTGSASEAQDENGSGAGTDRAEIEIVLPQNESWYSSPVCSVEDGAVRQVMFRDEITGSDAVVRASKKEDGDPSVFFYVFDDSKREKWSARAEDGTSIEITVEVTVENSDIHGVLATWEHGGVLYALWEDDAADAMDSVAKIAMAIAERSS